MKRLFFITAMFMACIGAIKADEIVVPNVVIPKGGTAILDIQLNNEQELNRSFWFFINLPDGVSVVDKSANLGERFNGTNVKVTGTPEDDGRYRIMAVNGFSEEDDFPIPGNSGTIVTVELMAGESIDEGTVLDASIENIEINLFSKETEATPSDVPTTANFQITIGEPDDGRLKFYETSTTLPSYTAGERADIKMFRTIKAGQWSTICLPFAMTSEQVVAAFGSDVELGDFNGIETTYEDENETIVSGIKVKFNTVTAIEANHPYIIRVGTPVSTFTVDNVDIIVEETPSVDKDEYSYQVQVGKNKYETRYMYNSFVGTYVAETEIPEKCLFLSDNQFWYSTGQTKSKGFRAYFDFYEWLPEAELSSSRVQMVFDESEATGISGVKHESNDDRYYNLSGQRVENPKKGLYIKNNKKVVVK